MPRIWPSIKKNVVCKVIPSFCSINQTETEIELYTPQSDTKYGDKIAEGDSLIYYFYRDSCPYCMGLEPLMAGLPNQITLPDGTISDVKLICLNKAEDEYLRIITNYYDEHNVPEERKMVPSVVIGNQYLFLNDEIVDQLMDFLIMGEGVETEMLDGAERVGAS